jgi:dipeptidyl aminopeptidase/acylaminoacyl peptidase
MKKRSAIGRWLIAASLALGLAGPARAGESAEAIFPGDGVSSIRVSPTGDWIAARVHRGEETLVVVQRVGLPGLVSVAQSKEIGDVAWESANTLVIPALSSAEIPQTLVVRLSLESGRIAADHRKISANGWLVDPLPFAPEQVLWVFPGNGWTSLHRISFSELLDYNELYRISGGKIDIAETLAVVKGSSSHWVAQRDGTPRAALRRGKDFTALMMPSRLTGGFESVYRFADDRAQLAVYPVGLTADEKHLLVLAYKGRNTMGLYEWDDRASAVGAAVFVHPQFDLDGVLVDRLSGDLIAAVYDEGGEPRYHYFKAYRDRFFSKLPEAWQKDSIGILSGTADRQVFAFVDSSATNPGDYYVRDRAGRILKVGKYAENVDREKLSPVEAFRVKAKDGIEIEAFLALPRGARGRAPLVVMPHGGPIGVQDDRQYEPMVQYLASWGFAVLQVNYRGSSGYGREFEAMGKKQWARGIEDDIDAAVESVMARADIDPERICIVGGSYGGFSAFASVIRHADRYRCAISINGVSDLTLQYDSSDIADRESGIEFYKEYVGDIEKDREKLIALSPAYHVRDISAPTLVIQGTDDRRVDPDNAHRMILMFELYGKPHETLEIEDAGHGFDRDEWIIVARAVRRFLSAHLLPEGAFRPDP